MSGPVSGKPIIPSITGIPVLDTVAAGLIVGASGVLTGICLGWANAHGFTDPNLGTEIGGAITGTLSALAIIIWRALQSRKTQTAVADHVITAAATGQIPDSIVKEAVKAPSISDTKIEKAIQNSEAIKEKQ